jgi:hypothetical protein
MRRCFVHVGTHKTGTSSIQAFLAMNEDALLSAGILVPLTGRTHHSPENPSAGHHNIAWELNDDPRFTRGAGTLRELISEVEQSGAQTVVLSSEDFEYLHADPSRLSPLVNAMAELGYSAEIIIYLRPQSEYAQSLYRELLKHGLELRFSDFLDVILARGAFVFQDRWIFRFEYSLLLAAFAGLAGNGGVRVRRYDQNAGSHRLLAEFASIVQPPDANASFDRFRLPGRLNPRVSRERALELYTMNRSPSNSGDALDAPSFDDWSAEDGARVRARFGADNHELAERYHVHLETADPGEPP